MHKECTLASSALRSEQSSGKGREASRLSDGWTSERTEERMSRMRVRGRNSGLHVFHRTTPRLENEGQSAVRISRRNEQSARVLPCVNRFVACKFPPRISILSITHFDTVHHAFRYCPSRISILSTTRFDIVHRSPIDFNYLDWD